MGDNRDDIRRSTGAPEGEDGRADLWRDEHLAAEILSEYLDEPDGFGPRDRAAIDAHLAGCAACQATLDDLHILVTALAAMPEPVPARSFRLTPELLEERDLPRSLDAERRPIDIQRTSAWRRRQIAAVRYATATAAVLLVLVLGADLISNAGGSVDGDDDDSAPAPASVQQSGATDAAPTEDAQSISATPAGGRESELAQATTASGAAPTATAAGAAPEPGVSTAGTAAEPTATAAAASGASEATPTEETIALNQLPTEAPAEDQTADASTREGVADSDETSSSSRSGWRTLEFGLVLLLAWLLALLVILPRLGSRRARRE